MIELLLAAVDSETAVSAGIGAGVACMAQMGISMFRKNGGSGHGERLASLETEMRLLRERVDGGFKSVSKQLDALRKVD